MGAKILVVRISASAVLATLLILLTASALSDAQTLATGTYVYALGTDGSADVNIIISNVTGQTTIYVKVDPGILPESLVAVDEKGNIVPTSIVSSTIVQAIPANQSTQLFIRYEAIVGEVSGGLVKDIITPGGPATIRLPAGAALLYFNGTPSSIKMVGNQIVIEYPSAGTYEIEFTLPPPPTTTATTSTTTTAVTTTTTPSTSTTSTTTTSITTTTTSTTTTPTTTTTTSTRPTSTTTVTPTTTTSTPQTTTASSTTQTTATTATVPPSTTTSSAATTATPATTTRTQQSTETSSSTITKPQPSQGSMAWAYALIVIVIVAAIIAAVALRSRRASRGGSSAAGVGELMRAEELDERDYEILRTLKEGTETISSLARRLGLSKSVVWRRVQKLLRLGLISKEDKGGRTYLSITEEGLKKLGEQA